MTPWRHNGPSLEWKKVVYLQDYARCHPSTWVVEWLGCLSVGHLIDLVGLVLSVG